MRNHDEKTKNMQRSVLPSTRRGAARAERRRIHKSARARERDMLAEYTKNPNATEPDFGENRRKSATHWMVLERRAADKIGPLTRWACRTVETEPELRDAALHEQVAYFEALLPTDLIGKHAVGHIYWALLWEFHRDTYRGRYYYRLGGLSRGERRDQVAADAVRILESGRHRELNLALRRAYEAGPPSRRFAPPVPAPATRLLLGAHDIDDFAAEASQYPWVSEAVAQIADRHAFRDLSPHD